VPASDRRLEGAPTLFDRGPPATARRWSVDEPPGRVAAADRASEHVSGIDELTAPKALILHDDAALPSQHHTGRTVTYEPKTVEAYERSPCWGVTRRGRRPGRLRRPV